MRSFGLSSRMHRFTSSVEKKLRLTRFNWKQMAKRQNHRSTQMVQSHLPGGAMSTPSNTFLGPTRVHNPNSILIGSAVFAGLTIVTNWQICATLSVTISRIYVRTTSMQPKNGCYNSECYV